MPRAGSPQCLPALLQSVAGAERPWLVDELKTGKCLADRLPPGARDDHRAFIDIGFGKSRERVVEHRVPGHDFHALWQRRVVHPRPVARRQDDRSHRIVAQAAVTPKDRFRQIRLIGGVGGGGGRHRHYRRARVARG